MCVTREVAGMTQVTAGCETMNLRNTCAQLRAAEFRGVAGQLAIAHVREQRAFLERTIDEHGDAALLAERQQPPLRLARRDRIVELREIEGLGAQHRLEIGVRADACSA